MYKMTKVEELTEETRKKWAGNILLGAEDDILAMSMAKERAACGEWPAPETANDYLAWIADETLVQLEQWIGHPEEDDRIGYAAALCKVAADLVKIGVAPSVLPWKKEA